MKKVSTNMKFTERFLSSIDPNTAKEIKEVEIVKSLAEHLFKEHLIDIKEEHDEYHQTENLSTEFYIMKTEEFHDIIEILRRITSQTPNYYINNGVKEIYDILISASE